jgi:hypothetical protein
MSTDTNNISNQPPRAGQTTASHFYGLAVPAIYALACAFLAISVAAFFAWQRWGKATLAYAVWGAVVGVLTFIIAALTTLVRRDAGRWSDEERQRVVALALLGVFGFALAALGLTLPFAYPDVFGGPLSKWRENLGTVASCAGLLLVGLFVLVVGLTMGRQLAAAYANLRRAVAFYNAVTGTLLLVVVLILVNLMSYISFAPFKALGATYDWTSSHLYSLSDASKQVLAGLKEPVKIYAIGTRNDLLTPEIETLLENCRAVTPLVSWESVSRDLQRREFAELDAKYQIPGDGLGLLVVYGTGDKPSHEFVRRSDLFENESTRPGEPVRFSFKGESALINVIKYLSENKTRANVYFTQGHGEPDLSGMGRGGGRQGLFTLKDDLEKRKYDVKPLKLGLTPAVPADADVVVMVAPQRELGAPVIAALRDYLRGTGRKDKGRLIVLMPPAANRLGTEVKTGLEPLLAEFSVNVGRDRVLTVLGEGGGRGAPFAAVAIPNPDSNNPIAKAFMQGGAVQPFRFEDARSVAAAQGGPAGSFTAEEIFIVPPDFGVWKETNLQADPMAVYRDLLKDRARLEKTISQTGVPVAVAVTEGKAPPMMPGHPPIGGESEPRLVVYGDASWVDDQSMSGGRHYLNIDLFSSTLSWLRKKADIGVSAEAKERKEYRPQVPPGGGLRIIVLPITMGLLLVFMLGGAVWVVRRR